VVSNHKTMACTCAYVRVLSVCLRVCMCVVCVCALCLWGQSCWGVSSVCVCVCVHVRVSSVCIYLRQEEASHIGADTAQHAPFKKHSWLVLTQHSWLVLKLKSNKIPLNKIYWQVLKQKPNLIPLNYICWLVLKLKPEPARYFHRS